MMMTRDSNGWWWVMGGAVLTIISSRMDLIDRIIGHRDWVHALVELLALTVFGGAGVARMSPLAISPEGRTKAMRKKGKQLDKATVAATVAAVKADKAVQATSDAADAATVAKDVSAKAGGL